MKLFCPDYYIEAAYVAKNRKKCIFFGDGISIQQSLKLRINLYLRFKLLFVIYCIDCLYHLLFLKPVSAGISQFCQPLFIH